MPLDFFIWHLDKISYFGIFISLVAVNLTPFPEELLILSIGYLAALGVGNIYVATLVGVISLLVGDNILFWLSRKGSRYVQRFEERIMQEKFLKFKGKMVEHIGKTIFISRFLNSFRILGPFLAGSMEVSWKKFQFFDFLALIIYVPLLTFLGHAFHDQIIVLIGKIEAWRHVSFVLFLIMVGVLSKIFISNKIYKKGE